MSVPSTRIASTIYSQERQAYSPYDIQEEDINDKRVELGAPLPLPTEKRSRAPGVGFYRSISWVLGFHEKYSLLNCEWFWFHAPVYRINLLIHIYLTILGGIGAVLQFLPAIRRRNVLLHRLNGYGVLFCLIVGNICGAIVGRRSFGGELNVQSAYYILGIMVVYSGLLGIYNVKKDTRRHRKWMLRMVVYFGAIITARLIMLSGTAIITDIGTYFSIWRCDEVLNLLTDLAARERDFPQCVASGVNTASVWVAVHASNRDGPLHAASALRAITGMALWIATLIHMAAVECYIILTEPANQVRLGFVLEPLDLSEDSNKSY
ncbi:hypothetical protein C8F01DRAFT_1273765 [Mycena amicta]|nr:hypothetical protein C8F01DRAFT_1273765 [Mycena amicta]